MIRIGISTVSETRTFNGQLGLLTFKDNENVLSNRALLTPSQIKHLHALKKRKVINGIDGEMIFLHRPLSDPFSSLLLVGVGFLRELTSERLRRAGARYIKKVSAHSLDSSSIYIENQLLASPSKLQALLEGVLLGSYKFDKYITIKKRNSPPAITLFVRHRKNIPLLRSILTRAEAICQGVLLARDLGNAPGNEIYPETLAEKAKMEAASHGYTVTVLDEDQIRELGMGGVIGVSQGSTRPPRFIIMEYGKSRKKPIVLVGKGVTFDSGGISIKSAAGMSDMKMDMAGAAAIIGTIVAAAKIQIPLRIIGIIPAVENMPSGSALRPGDIIRHHNGMTSEIDNTDAEGRLILADALSFARAYKPSLIIDLATLTGACVVALGHVAAGMFGNDKRSMRRLFEAGEASFERIWELPLYDEYDKLIKSDVADIKNSGGRWAGAITAALFLKRFVEDTPWIHLDIAGTAILDDSLEYSPRGASGYGVRLLIEFLRSIARK